MASAQNNIPGITFYPLSHHVYIQKRFLVSQQKAQAGGVEAQGKPTEKKPTGLKSAASLTSDALMGRGGVGCSQARDCDAVLRDVRRRTARERVRIIDLFKDFDRLQHGKSFAAIDSPLRDFSIVRA